MTSTTRPLLLVTPGDVAGVGPELIVRAWQNLIKHCYPVVVGDLNWMRRASERFGPIEVQPIERPQKLATPSILPVIQSTKVDLSAVEIGKVSGEAGQAAFDFLSHSIDLTLTQQAEGIVTLPLHKEGLHLAGLPYPGHTEILAERCRCPEHAMLLYVQGLGVAHVTLHMALRDVFASLSEKAIVEKAHLLNEMMTRLLNRRPRLAVAALNPHASDGGLFGDEEETMIQPAVRAAKAQGLDISGPFPADTLFTRAREGGFDGVVAMYHDQGHIALKLLGEWHAVNITAGLPIVRTSVAHGTAYDIAWQGVAKSESLLEAVSVASRLIGGGKGNASALKKEA